MRIFNLSPQKKSFIVVFLLLLVATSLQAVHPSSQPLNLDKKAVSKIPQRTPEKKASSIDTPLNSTDGYECLAALLAGSWESLESAKKELQALEWAFRDMNLGSICPNECLLNPAKASEKKNQLNQLLTFLDESEERLEKIISDLKWQALSKIDVDEDFRKGFIKGYDQAVEERKYLLRKSYAIKKDLVRASIKLLDFLSAKISDSSDQKANSGKIFESDKDLEEFKAHYDAVESLLKADEAIPLLSGQCRTKGQEDLQNPSSILPQPKKSEALLRMEEMYKEKIKPFNQAFAAIDWDGIYTEAVVSSMEKMVEKKKELERIRPLLDEMEKKWETEIPDSMHQVAASSDVSNQDRERIEEFIRTVLPFEKQIISIRKKYTFEYLELLSFLSARYGNYKIDKCVRFSYAIEHKLCDSHLKNIQQLRKEEQAAVLQITHLIQRLCEQRLSKKNSP